MPTAEELQRKPSETNYLTSLSNPQSFYDKLPAKSISENFLNDSLSLSQISRLQDIGAFTVRALLNRILVDVVMFFEVGKSMGADQVKQTVELILEDYSHFKPEDFKLCFNRLKKGHYGKLYDRLDGQIILDCLMQYDNERDGEIESIRTRENRQLKQLEQQPLLPSQPVDAETDEKREIFDRNMKKLKETLEQNKKAREEKLKVDSKPVQNPMYHLHMQWIRQFDNLYKRKPVRGGVKFIKRYGQMLDISAYLEYKQLQYIDVLDKLEERRK